MAYAIEDPLQLITSTMANFSTTSDLNCLARINDDLRTIRECQSVRLEASRTANADAHRRATDAKRRVQAERDDHDLDAHLMLVDELEGQKWDTAKAAGKCETEAERLAGECRGLEARLRDMDRVRDRDGRVGCAEGRVNAAHHDETILKLRVYRSLGIDLEHNADTDDFARAVVRDPIRKDAHVIDLLREQQQSGDTVKCADRIWNCLPG